MGRVLANRLAIKRLFLPILERPPGSSNLAISTDGATSVPQGEQASRPIHSQVGLDRDDSTDEWGDENDQHDRWLLVWTCSLYNHC